MTDQRPIGYWLKLVDRLIDEQFASTLEEHGVTRRQWQLLSVLSRGAASVEEMDVAIAPFLAADPEGAQSESSAEHLSELIESGWVAATPSGYETTERGQTAYGKLAEVVGQNRARIAGDISETEYSQTVDVLERMARNLGFTG